MLSDLESAKLFPCNSSTTFSSCMNAARELDTTLVSHTSNLKYPSLTREQSVSASEPQDHSMPGTCSQADTRGDYSSTWRLHSQELSSSWHSSSSKKQCTSVSYPQYSHQASMTAAKIIRKKERLYIPRLRHHTYHRASLSWLRSSRGVGSIMRRSSS